MAPPLADRLHELPAEGVDLKRIVQYPPKMGLIPVKPIFLDVAWDYIDYPGKAKTVAAAGVQAVKGAVSAAAGQKVEEKPQKQQQQQPRKGWFGFGR